MHDLEARLDDEEDRSNSMSQEKKKLQLTIKVIKKSEYVKGYNNIYYSQLRLINDTG